MPTDKSRQYGPPLERTYQFILWLIPTEKFPRDRKFLLGDRIIQ